MKPMSLTLSFEVEHAVRYGIEAACILFHFRHWVEINHASERNFYHGRTYTYQTQEALLRHFPWMSRRTLQRILNILTGPDGPLIKGNFNKHGYDRTIWYAFKDESEWIRDFYRTPQTLRQNDALSIESETLCQNDALSIENNDSHRHCAKMSYALRQNEPTIPDNKPDNTLIDCPPTPAYAVSGGPENKKTKVKAEIVKKKLNGEKYTVTESEVFRWALAQKKDWAADEVSEAYKRLCETGEVISDPYRYIEGTINNLRKKKTFANLDVAIEKVKKYAYKIKAIPKPTRFEEKKPCMTNQQKYEEWQKNPRLLDAVTSMLHSQKSNCPPTKPS